MYFFVQDKQGLLVVYEVERCKLVEYDIMYQMIYDAKITYLFYDGKRYLVVQDVKKYLVIEDTKQEHIGKGCQNVLNDLCCQSRVA